MGLSKRLPRGRLMALTLLGLPAAAQAEDPNFGINFRDYVIYDSRGGYAGDIKSEHAELDLHDGRALVRDGMARAGFGTLGISSFAATLNNGGYQPIVRNEEFVKAWSYEIFHIGGSSPIGTPVTLSFRTFVDIAGGGRVSAPFAANYFPCPIGVVACVPTGLSRAAGGSVSDLAAGISFDFNHVFDPATCSQYAGSGCTGTPLQVGLNLIVIDRLAHVGDTLALRTRFEAATSQYHPFAATGYSGAGFFALNTAHTYLSVSSPDVVVTALSGYDYTLSAVPEPASWAMLLGGIGFVGAARRRSRSMARVVC